MYAFIMIICTACGGENSVDAGSIDELSNLAPQLEINGPSTVELGQGDAYRDGGATAVDREDGDLTSAITISGVPVDTETAGTHVVVYRVVDSDGAAAEAERLVRVAENMPPRIKLNGAAKIDLAKGSKFLDPGARARDPEDGDLSANIRRSGEVNTNVPGDYEVEYLVSDSGGAEANVTRVVTVLAPESPFPHIPLTIEAEGFTQILPSEDSRLVYVSSSMGNDANDGLSPEFPVQNISRGKDLLRDGSPDWLLLKLDDEWGEGLGRWTKSGRSKDEPMVVTNYGDGTERPLLMSGARDGLRASGGGGSPKIIDNLVFSGLHFYAQTRDPDASTFVEVTNNRGINWFRGSTYLLFEDNYIEHYKEGIQMHDLDNLNISGVVIRRNIIVDSFAVGAHSQGMYLAQTDGVLIEENIFDHNGWHAELAGAQATKFNHSVYIQKGNVGVEVHNNIISRSSSHGMQLRPGGEILGNFLIRNPISILLGLNDDGDDDGAVRNNVILNGNDINSDNAKRGWGIDFNPQNNAIVENNIIAHVLSDSGNRFAIKQSPNATYINNIVYKWDEGTDDPMNYQDPDRTIEEYDALMGGDGTYESFISNLRTQSRLAWNPAYSVEQLKQFFRDGFAEKTD
ncbi:immunoglobulin-like domain-containing protein [Microbulbifer agarilyticus]